MAGKWWTDEDLEVALIPELTAHPDYLEECERRKIEPRSHNARSGKRADHMLASTRNRVRRSPTNAPIPVNEEEITEVEEHRLKGRVRQLAADKRRLINKQTVTEDVIAALAPLVPQIQAVGYPTKSKKTYTHQREMILVLSDMHGYSRIAEKEMGGLGEYNAQLMGDRAKALVQSIASIKAKHGDDVVRLNLFVDGDLIENAVIFRGQHREIDAGTMEQVVGSSRIIIGIIGGLLDVFEEIHVYDVCGNHGRLTPAREAGPPIENYDWLVMQIVQISTTPLHGDRLVFHPSEAWFRLVERFGFRFLLIHGHEIRSWGGTPQNAVMANASKFFQLITTNLPPEVTGPGFHYMVLGHFHTRAWMESTAFEVFMNGAWPGASQYSTQQLKASSRPAQLLLAIHPNHGVTDCWPLFLAPRAEMPTVEIDRD